MGGGGICGWAFVIDGAVCFAQFGRWFLGRVSDALPTPRMMALSTFSVGPVRRVTAVAPIANPHTDWTFDSFYLSSCDLAPLAVGHLKAIFGEECLASFTASERIRAGSLKSFCTSVKIIVLIDVMLFRSHN